MKHPHTNPPAKPEEKPDESVRHPTTFTTFTEKPVPAAPEPVAEKQAPTTAETAAANQNPPTAPEGWTWDNSSGRYKKNAV